MHARMRPRAHRFRYRVFNLVVDLARLSEADGASRLFSVNRFNLASFHEADHGEGRGRLLDWVGGLLRDVPAYDGGRVLLLCYPRILGFVFNPISVYFCYAREGALAAVIYEVRNTFGQKHSYVCPVAPGEATPAGLRQSRAKRLYVSPFLGMAMRYHFRLLPPGETTRLRILETDADGPILAASFIGARRDLDDAALLAECARVPLASLKVVAGIHWEAARLWLKGVRLHPRPAPPKALSSLRGDPA